jgi:hypothetical protein
MQYGRSCRSCRWLALWPGLGHSQCCQKRPRGHYLNLGPDDRERGIMMTMIMLTTVVPMFKYAFAQVDNFWASSKPWSGLIETPSVNFTISTYGIHFVLNIPSNDMVMELLSKSWFPLPKPNSIILPSLHWSFKKLSALYCPTQLSIYSQALEYFFHRYKAAQDSCCCRMSMQSDIMWTQSATHWQTLADQPKKQRVRWWSNPEHAKTQKENLASSSFFPQKLY